MAPREHPDTPREHHIAVRRTARYFTLGPEAAPELWIVVHGYSQLAGRFIRRFDGIADGSRRFVAPEALNRYYFESGPGEHGPDARIGATWMTREDRTTEIADYVAYLDVLFEQLAAERSGRPARIIVLGFSQGVATVARWLASGRARVDHVVLWAGYLPTELSAHSGLFHGAAFTWVVGRADPYTPESRIAEASAGLQRAGLDHRVRWYQGGHRIEPAALELLAAELR